MALAVLVSSKSVRRRADDGLGADIAASAWLVFNDERLAKPVRQALADQAGKHVGGAARRVGNHPSHRTGRVGVGLRRATRFRRAPLSKGMPACRSSRPLKSRISRHRRNPVGSHGVPIIVVKFLRVHKGLRPHVAQF